MFIDEQTQVTIYANLDETVIRGTHRSQDLVPAFLDIIKDTQEYVQILQTNNEDLKVIFEVFTDDDERWESEYMQYFLNEGLFDTLNSYAPDGYYFGCHTGDGSDYGFWKIEEEI